MTKAQARKLVEDGLTLRKERREAAEQETRMEAYEKEMITFCNGNCANARKNREKDAETALALVLEENRKKEEREQMIAFRKREREQLRMEMERDACAMDAVRRFAMFCSMTALVTVWTPFPWWAAVALVVGTAFCTGAYVFRVYFPFEQ